MTRRFPLLLGVLAASVGARALLLGLGIASVVGLGWLVVWIVDA